MCLWLINKTSGFRNLVLVRARPAVAPPWRGAEGQPVQLNLVDLQGKPIHAQQIGQAGELERVSLPLGASNGVFLLQVSTPTQQQQLKLLGSSTTLRQGPSLSDVDLSKGLPLPLVAYYIPTQRQ
jgi:hypothetical protein